MPDRLKAGVEGLSGVSLDDVRVHYRSPRPAQFQAHALTQGSEIHVAPGQERHLAHEVWHVTQQKRQRVKPTGRMRSQPINDSPELEHEADVMGQRALSHRTADAEPAVAPARAVDWGQQQSPVQAKRIMRGYQTIEVPDDYVLQEGEIELQEPNTNQLQQGQSAFRGALDPSGQDTSGGGKYPFPFSFFDNAFDTRTENVRATVKGGTVHNITVSRPSESTTPGRLLPTLPGTLTKGGHLGRILNASDLSGHGASSSNTGAQVTIDRLREALAGLQYAREQGLDLNTIHQPSAQIDFRAVNPRTQQKVDFDPFISPQPLAPTKEHLAGQELLKRGIQPPPTYVQRPENPGRLQARRRAWVNDTYVKHTGEQKGKGVVGIWDQTSDSQTEVNELKQAITGVPPGLVHPIDLQLDREYARENFLAQQQINRTHALNEHFIQSGDSRFIGKLPPRQRLPQWRRLMEERNRRLGNARQAEKRRQLQGSGGGKRLRREALPWGGPRPGDYYSPWGENHPLYWRHGWRKDGDGEGGTAV